MIKEDIDVFAEDDLYLLKPLSEEDRDKYMKTVIVNSSIPKIYSIPGYCDVVWRETPEKWERIFCVFEKADDSYCGFCNIRKTNTSVPEIGISLLPDFQGRKIGCRVLPLMMKAYISNYRADYFIARVYSDNYRSLRLMKKIGAVQFETEESEYKRVMDSLYKSLREEDIDKIKKYEIPGDYRYICVFKIEPF